jgi:hypothetical protein
MNILNSLAVLPQAAQGVPQTKPALSMLSERSQFESALASADKQAKSEINATTQGAHPVLEKSDVVPKELDAVPDDERPPAAPNAPSRRKDKSKFDDTPIPVPGAGANTPAAMPIDPATTDVAIVKESGDAAPAVSTASFDTSCAKPDVDAAADADANTGDSETFMETQNPATENTIQLPNLSSLEEAVGRNTVGDGTHDASAGVVGETHAISESKASATLSMNEAVDMPQSSPVTDPGPVTQAKDIAQTSAASPPPRSGYLQTLADAFETSIRYFERTGDNWVGSAHITLKSSILKGAAFQIVSDGKSLSILLSKFSAPVSISRRQESELSEILTRKLGRNVSLNLIASEIESAEAPEYAEQQ